VPAICTQPIFLAKDWPAPSGAGRFSAASLWGETAFVKFPLWGVKFCFEFSRKRFIVKK
jgi:hypothetical protein